MEQVNFSRSFGSNDYNGAEGFEFKIASTYAVKI